MKKTMAARGVSTFKFLLGLAILAILAGGLYFQRDLLLLLQRESTSANLDKVSADVPQPHDLSSVASAPNTAAAASEMIGTYVLEKADNPVCGEVGDMMLVQSVGDGSDKMIKLAHEQIKFMDINAGVMNQPAYEGDPEHCAYARKTIGDSNSLASNEIQTCEGKIASKSATSLTLGLGRLVYKFHQQSFNPAVAVSGDIECEWTRR